MISIHKYFFEVNLQSKEKDIFVKDKKKSFNKNILKKKNKPIRKFNILSKFYSKSKE